MKINKVSFFLLLLVSLIVIVIFTNSCSEGNEISDSTAETPSNETGKENVNVTKSEEIDKTKAESTEETDSTSSNTKQKEALPDETKTDKNIITFKGNKVNENTATMILEVNVKSGEVSGILQMGFKNFDMDANSTKICDYVLTGSIKGNLNFETFKIEGFLQGKAVTDTVFEDCRDYDVNYKMFASVADDYNKIRGYFNTNTMDKYEFFLKQVSE